MESDIENAWLSLKSILSQTKPAIIAFSGGVDSTFLLKAAVEIIGKERVRAVICESPLIPSSELASALSFVSSLDVRYDIIPTDELSIPGFINNTEERCYLCKNYRFGRIREFTENQQSSYILEGSNVDDTSDFRPGMRAVKEHQVRSPLLEAGLTKAVIRELSKKFKLPTWNKPSDACLATRIQCHQPITVEKLKMIETAETFFRQLGVTGVLRVRYIDDTARIEMNPDEIQLLADIFLRERITNELKKLGFRKVTLDLEGYRMGSTNSNA